MIYGVTDFCRKKQKKGSISRSSFYSIAKAPISWTFSVFSYISLEIETVCIDVRGGTRKMIR